MISVTQNNQVYEIRFQYDPAIIELIKNVPGRRWEPTENMWTIPLDKLGFLINQFKGTLYEQLLDIKSNEDLNVNKQLEFTERSAIPDVDLSGFTYKVAHGLKIFEHQKDSVKFYVSRKMKNPSNGGYLLADEMGTGKSLSVMNIAMFKREKLKSKHCLIVACVNSAKWNWLEDIEKHSNGLEHPYILGTRLFTKGKKKGQLNQNNIPSKAKVEDLLTGHMYGDVNAPKLPYFLVTNIESFRAKEGRTYTFTDALVKMCSRGDIDVIALDEIHKNASPTSQQGKQVLNLKKAVPHGIDWIPMTGTPITKCPLDVFLPLRLIDGHTTSSFYAWQKSYCVFGGYGGHEIIGYKNIPHMKSILEPNMLRRKKDEILDLPDKIRQTIYVENTPYQQKLYDEIVDDMRNNRESIVKSLNPMTAFFRLRQVNGSPELVDPLLTVDDKYLSKNAKLAALMELIDEIVANGEKVIVFSNWVEPLRTLYSFVSKKYGTCVFTGTMKEDARQQHKRVFMTNPNYPVMLGTVGAMGTSHTLTAATNIIFYDRPWSPSDAKQCEDRCHRPGQTKSVRVISLITKDTVDEKVENILAKKESISDYIVDNGLDIRSNPELFDLLLGNK